MNYYYNNGKTVRLEREASVYAVRYLPGRDSRDANFSRRAFRLLHEESENIGFIPNYNLQLYRTRPEVISRLTEPSEQINDVLKVIRSLGDEPPVEFATVAYRRHAERAANQVEDLMFVDCRFMVQFKPEIRRQQIDEFNQRYGVTVIEPLGYAENGFLLEAPQAEGEQGPVALANLYYESGLTLFAHPNFIRRRQVRQVRTLDKRKGTHSKPRGDQPSTDSSARDERSVFLPQQWHLRLAKVEEAWNITRGNRTIKVAVLDDGVDTSHSEFAGKVSAQHDFASGSSDGNPKSSSDKHGTACAGVAVASGVKAFGAAPGCSLMAIRTPDFLGVAEEAAMFQWVADQGADVISCSWGPADGTGAVDPLPDNVRAAIRYCVSNGRAGRGIPVFWAAGNGDESVSNDGYAANPDVMAIAASTSNEKRAWYSDFGPEIFICAPSSGDKNLGDRRVFTADRRGNQGYNPDKTGATHPSSDLDYTDDFGGTSSSTPLVAGIAGLMLSANSALRLPDMRQILRDSADKIDTTNGAYDGNGHSMLYGFGRVNAQRAVEQARDVAGGSNGGGGTGGTTPTISSDASINRNDGPPVFQINTAGRPLYAVEVATQAELFNFAVNGSQRNQNNFYGSWQDGMSSVVPYTLPSAVWDRLKSADRLYYRLHVAADSSWSNYGVTISDSQAASAPSIAIVASSGGGPGGSTTPTISIAASVNQSDPPPIFQIGTGGRSLYAVEVATRAELFNHAVNGSQRTADNFYGSWQEGLSSVIPFTLPAAVWARLNLASRLFYRLHVADDVNWSNYAATVSDSQASSAPSFQVLAGSAPGGGTGGGTGGGGTGGGTRTITFPSGASFQEVASPQDGIDYSDPVGNADVPLIEVRGRLAEKLSRNFTVKELAASDGTRYARIALPLVEGLQRVRDRLGSALTVVAGYRHPALNSAVEGTTQSQHIAGRAVSIRSNSVGLLDLARIVLEEMGCDIGIGLGRNTLHVDLRGQQASFVFAGASMTESQFDQWVSETCRSIDRQAGNPRRRRRNDLLDGMNGAPSINGPERLLAEGEAPSFFITLGAGRYYAVEVASHPDLLGRNLQAQRSADTFYSSWISEGARQGMETTTYYLPEAAWENLRKAERLYYRVVTSVSAEGLADPQYASVGEAALGQAPWIEIAHPRQVRQEPEVIRPLNLRLTRAGDEARWRG